MATRARRPSRRTLYAFIKKNQGNLEINVDSSFDPMTDCVMPIEKSGFTPAQPADREYPNNCGMRGVWLVLGGRDFIEEYEDDTHKGYKVSNSCGTWTLAVRK